MKRHEVIKFLEGKTIDKIEYNHYLGWLVIDSIIFKDGTVLDLDGHASCSIISTIEKPDGSFIEIEEIPK